MVRALSRKKRRAASMRSRRQGAGTGGPLRRARALEAEGRLSAACLDVPVWVMSRLASHFNLGGATNAFYPSSREFVRLPDPDWSNVIARIADDLAGRVRTREEAA